MFDISGEWGREWDCGGYRRSVNTDLFICTDTVEPQRREAELCFSFFPPRWVVFNPWVYVTCWGFDSTNELQSKVNAEGVISTGRTGFTERETSSLLRNLLHKHGRNFCVCMKMTHMKMMGRGSVKVKAWRNHVITESYVMKSSGQKTNPQNMKCLTCSPTLTCAKGTVAFSRCLLLFNQAHLDSLRGRCWLCLSAGFLWMLCFENVCARGRERTRCEVSSESF